MDFHKSSKNRKETRKTGEVSYSAAAVVVAAGRGERMKSEISKQFLPLCEIPALARTLSAFEESRRISHVVVVTSTADFLDVAGLVREFGFSKVTKIVRGGDTRQASARAGLEALGDADYIAVHDGARPLVTPECIDRVVEAAFEFGAAAAAVRVKDTVKQTDENGFVLSTPDRSRLWLVQTPQVFELGLYRDAMLAAEDAGADYTDDCQLIESAGSRVRLVEGEYTNIKLTTRDDVYVAEAILKAREEEQ